MTGQRLLGARTVIAIGLHLLVRAGFCAAQELPLEFEQRFDQVVLTKANGSIAVRVFPVGFNVQNEPDRTRPLRVRVLDYPDRQYDVAWRDIERIEYFEDVLLTEVRKLTKARKYEDAYRLLALVWKTAPAWRGLAETTEEFLYQDALGAYRQQQFEESLLVFDELFRGNASKPNVANAILRVTDRVFDESLKRRDYRAARHVIHWVAGRPQLEAANQVGQWRQRMRSIAEAHVTTARQALESKQYRLALESIDRALQVWPGDDRAVQLASAILKEYPRVEVGVSRIAGAALDYDYDWATLRTNRLVGRALLELEDYGANGGEYSFPLGNLTIDEDEQGARFMPSRNFQSSAAAIAGFVESLACDGKPPCQPMLYRMLESVTLEPNRGLHVRLRSVPAGRRTRGQSLRWLPYLDVPLDRAAVGPSIAAYTRQDADPPGATAFLASDQYAWHERGQPTEVFERFYADSAAMVAALKDGEVDLLDRISPAAASRLRGSPGITVGEYAFPSCYFLVPNLNKRLMTERTFRRALAYGIHRESILRNVLLGGKSYVGCQLITGPFPAATSRRDAMDYAYETSIEPRAFDPALASSLSAMARHRVMMDAPELSDESADESADERADERADGEARAERESVILVHPQDGMLAQSAVAIARSLSLAGIECQARALPLGQVRPQNEDWDLWMIDVTFHEPIVDIQRMFGARGLVPEPSTYVVQALDDLSRVTRWTDARVALRDIHVLVHSELSLIPLWQLTNHFAYSGQLSGVTPKPTSLYHRVERWRIAR